MAPRRCPSYSLGWGTLLCHSTHSYWLVILSTTPRDTPVTTSQHLTLRGTILGCAEVLQYACYKIGLIDPDDLTEENTKHTCGNTLSLTPSPEERNCRGNQADRLQIFPVSMTNVEVAISVTNSDLSQSNPKSDSQSS